MRYMDLLMDGQSGADGEVVEVVIVGSSGQTEQTIVCPVPDDGEPENIKAYVLWVSEKCQELGIDHVRDATFNEDPMPLNDWLDNVHDMVDDDSTE